VGETYKMMGIKGYTMSEMEVTLLLNQIDKEKKGAISLKDYELYTLESLSKSGI
jgi:Ca2+-binding EF-hand superfamily protein